jgi:hypothetical protein
MTKEEFYCSEEKLASKIDSNQVYQMISFFLFIIAGSLFIWSIYYFYIDTPEIFSKLDSASRFYVISLLGILTVLNGVYASFAWGANFYLKQIYFQRFVKGKSDEPSGE